MSMSASRLRSVSRLILLGSIACFVVASVQFLGPQDFIALVQNAALITAGVGLLAFLFTNFWAWRKEVREKEQFLLDMEKKRLEIVKLEAEIAALKYKERQNQTDMNGTRISNPATDF
jgi:hypothetical protein